MKKLILALLLGGLMMTGAFAKTTVVYFSATGTTIECNDPASRPAIANKIDISGYDTVIVCYPIWWAYAPKIVYTILESQKWDEVEAAVLDAAVLFL